MKREKESEFFPFFSLFPTSRETRNEEEEEKTSHRPRRSPRPDATPPAPERSSATSRGSGARHGPSGSGRSRPGEKFFFICESPKRFFFNEKIKRKDSRGRRSGKSTDRAWPSRSSSGTGKQLRSGRLRRWLRLQRRRPQASWRSPRETPPTKNSKNSSCSRRRHSGTRGTTPRPTAAGSPRGTRDCRPSSRLPRCGRRGVLSRRGREGARWFREEEGGVSEAR